MTSRHLNIDLSLEFRREFKTEFIDVWAIDMRDKVTYIGWYPGREEGLKTCFIAEDLLLPWSKENNEYYFVKSYIIDKITSIFNVCICFYFIS